MASRKEYEMLFQLNARLGGSYNSTFKTAQGAIASMQKEIAALSKTQSDITAYEKQQSAIEASKKKLEVLQKQYDNIQKEMNETGQYSSALENKLLTKQQQIDKTTASIASQTDKLNKMGNALREAGVDTADLANESAKLGRQIDELKSKQEEAADKANSFGAKASAAFAAAGDALVAAGLTVGLKKIADAYGEATKASMVFESAMTGVAKTTDMSDEELAAMSQQIKDMSTDIPIVTEDLAGIAEVAGQLGIAKDNLMDFSEVMAMLATATTMTAEEGATMLAQFANITQMDPTYYSNLASAVVNLGNNYATTEQKIIDMAQGIAASASLAGMTEDQMLGLSAAVTSLGIETQAGSTSMSKLIQELMTAVETGENLEEFARIANMSAEDFAKAWGDNAVTALQAFVLGLNDTERNGKSATVALTELGITETRMQRMILSLSNSGDLLNRTLATSAQGWAENTALVKEANLRYSTTESRLTMMQNSYNNLKIAIGDSLNPTLGEFYEKMTDSLGSVTDFIQKNPTLVRAVTAFVGVLGLATAGITAYVAVTKIATVVSAAFTAAIPGLNIIMGVVAGVAALTAGIVALREATKDETEDISKLTVESREQYYQMRDLEDEYNEVADAFGETSYEAQVLRRKVDEATEAFEENKQTVEELAEAHDAVIAAHNELMDSYDETIGGIDKEARSNQNLMKKLEELMAVEGKSAATKQEILTVVEMLNEAMPELGLAYDQYADSLNMSADAIRAVIEAEIAREKNAANYEKLKELISEEGALYDNLQAQIKETAYAEQQLTKAQEAEAKKREELGTPGMSEAAGREYASALLPYIEATSKAQAALEAATETEREAQEAYDENQAKIKELTNALAGYTDETGNASGVTDNLTGKIKNISDRMAELTSAYDEAYKAAHESVSGQYSLWDEAAEVVATSASTINKALQSQADYWKSYNTNLENLSKRADDIDGLAEMISSFADGSEGSVNAIAGMAKASDDELRKMVENWQKLQEEQKTVADSLADLETDFANSMDALQKELETAINEMDMNEEAAKSAKSTVEGFIRGAEDMLPAVKEAYSQIAQAGIDAIDAKLQIHSPSRVMWNRAEMAWSGYIKGSESMESDVKDVMAETANAGVKAIPAETLPSRSSGNGTVQLIVSPTYNFPGGGIASDIAAVLRDATEDLKEKVLDILEEAGIDAARRAYT